MPRDATPQSSLDHRLKVAIASLTALALLVIAAVRGYDLHENRQVILRDGERRAANTAFILSAHLRAGFAGADAALRQLTVYSAQIGGPTAPAEKWQPMLAVSRTQRNALGSVSVVDREGIIRHSTLPELIGLARRDNFVFRRLADAPDDVLVADTPLRSVVNPDLMFIPLGRRLVRADGSFDGIVVATFTPAYVRDFFQQVDVGRSGHIWVFHPAGFVFFHVPSDRNALGQSAAGNPVFERARDLAKPETVRFPARGREPANLTALEPVNEPRLLVAVSLGEPDLLGGWLHEAIISVIGIALIAIGFAAVLRFVFRQIDARAKAEAALTRAQRLAAIGQLTGGVAHDFNNLLTVIMMNASALRTAGGAGAAGSRDADLVEQIEGAARRGAALTQQLLTFARRQPLQAKLIDLNAIVRGLQPMLVRLLGEHIQVRLTLADEPCTANVDPVHVETALMNLCVNARDAMRRGGSLAIESRQVSVDAKGGEFETDLTPGRYVELAVIDTGSGIAPEHMPRLFEPFFTTKPVGEGTGLGLSMVYGFMKQSGGQVKVQSEPGRGTAVKLLFPLVLGTSSAPATVAPDVQPSQPQGRGETILLVEDEPVVRRITERMLTTLGYRVVSATDGPEALARARELSAIDLLLTDVMLPGGMNGREVAEQLSRERPGLRVLFATGYSEDILQHNGSLGPTLRVILKPFDLRDFAAAVRATLNDEPMPVRRDVAAPQ